MQGHNAKHGCHRCLQKSVKLSDWTVWSGHSAHLRPGDPLLGFFSRDEAKLLPAIRGEREALVLRKIAQEINDVQTDTQKPKGILGYKGYCALDRLHGNCGTHTSMCIDCMHILKNLMGYWVDLWSGTRDPKRLVYKPPAGDSTTQDWKEEDERAKRKFNEKVTKRAELREKLAQFKLDDPGEVDRRYASIDWPKGLTNKYLPMKDSGSFTAADWLHFIVYAGPWIMDGLLPRAGNVYDLWLWFVKAVTLLTRSSYTPDEAREAHRFTIRTVILAEAILPFSEHYIQWHLLIHLADDIIDKGPVLYYWMFRHERYWGTNNLQ